MGLKDQPKKIQRATLINKGGDTAMSLPAEKRVIIIATNKGLVNDLYFRRLWLAVKNLLVGKRREGL